jgi:hypothetical protein
MLELEIVVTVLELKMVVVEEVAVSEEEELLQAPS